MQRPGSRGRGCWGSGQARGPRAILSLLAPVGNHRSEGLARGPSHPAASLPGHFVPVRESWHTLVAWKGRDSSSSSEAKGERKVPASAAGSLRVRNAPFTSSMARCSCRFLETERGPSLLGQGKERGPCGQRTPLRFVRKPAPAGLARPAEKEEGPYGQPRVLRGPEGDTSKGGVSKKMLLSFLCCCPLNAGRWGMAHRTAESHLSAREWRCLAAPEKGSDCPALRDRQPRKRGSHFRGRNTMSFLNHAP